MGHSENTDRSLAERFHAGKKKKGFEKFLRAFNIYFFLGLVLGHDASSPLEADRATAVNPK